MQNIPSIRRKSILLCVAGFVGTLGLGVLVALLLAAVLGAVRPGWGHEYAKFGVWEKLIWVVLPSFALPLIVALIVYRRNRAVALGILLAVAVDLLAVAIDILVGVLG